MIVFHPRSFVRKMDYILLIHYYFICLVLCHPGLLREKSDITVEVHSFVVSRNLSGVMGDTKTKYCCQI